MAAASARLRGMNMTEPPGFFIVGTRTEEEQRTEDNQGD